LLVLFSRKILLDKPWEVVGPQDRHLGEYKQSGGRRGTINEGRGQQRWWGKATMTTIHINYISIKITLYAYLFSTHVVLQKLHSKALTHQIST
jgi:hypothetical protein